MNKTFNKLMILGAVAIAGTASGIAINQAVQRLDAPKRPTNTAASRALPLSADPTHTLSGAESAVYQQNSAPGGVVTPAQAKRGPSKMVSSDGKLRVNFIANSVVESSGHKRAAYSFAVDTKAHDLLREGIYAPYGGAAVDDELYAIQLAFGPMADFIVTWDMTNWNWTNVQSGVLLRLYGNDMAYDPWTDQVVSANNCDDGNHKSLFILDFKNFKRKQIGPDLSYSDQWVGIAAGKDCWYGMKQNGDFYKIDKQTVKETLVGNTGITPLSYTQTMIVDTKTQRLIWFTGIYDRDKGANYSRIYEIDPNTAKLTPLQEDDYYEQRTCAWSNEDLEGNYPGIATEFKSLIPLGDLTGDISFTAPTTTWDGKAATGDLDYTVLMDGRELKKGKTKYGETVKIPVTVAAAGSYKFSVNFTNSNGTSRWARLFTPIGFEQPAASTGVSMTLNGLDSKVSWSPVAKSTTGAALDTAQITYSVIRYPDKVEVAKDIKDTVFNETLTDPADLTVFYYGVKAKYAGMVESDETQSNGVALGKITPPYRLDFKDPHNIYAFSIFDIKNDGTFGNDKDKKDCISIGTWDAKDDWLISPAVKLEAGKFYKVAYSAANCLAPYINPEKILLKYGKTPTVEGMTEALTPDTISFSGYNFEYYGDYVQVKESGDYYFGLHAVNTKAYTLYVDEFTVSAPVEPDAPGCATEIKILSNYDDPNSVDISFKAPALTADGQPLDKIARIEVLRGGVPVGTFNNPRPGKEVRVSDYVDKRGETYLYTIVAYNDKGAGKAIDTKAFVGILTPEKVTESFGVENDGEITVKWKAPTTDIQGNRLNPANVKYTVSYRVGYTKYVVADSISATECKFKATLENPNVQSHLILNIEAITEGGTSEAAQVPPVACGKPFKMPFVESCANAAISSPISTITLKGDARWGIYSDASFTDVKSQDSDNGLLGLNSQYAGNSAMLAMGKVDLTGSKDPALTFYVFNIETEGGDKNTLDVQINAGDGFKSVKSFVIGTLPKVGEWNKVTIPLKDYKDKVVQFSIVGEIVNLTFTLVDNIRVQELLDYNMSLRSVSAPATVKPGNLMSLTTEVENTGEKDLSNVVVNFYDASKGDMELVKTQKLSKVAAGKTRLLKYEKTMSVLDPDTCRYFVEIEVENDQDETDNMSEEIIVKNVLPNDPVAENLKAVETGEGVSLTWNAPKTTGVDPTMTESFETATSWEKENAEGWTLVDKDGRDIGGANGITLPIGTKSSFYVLDNTDPQFNASWAAHSGNKYLANMYAKEGACDDWAISPELSGKAQTITFYARSYSSDYLEDMELLYSTTDNKPESFKKIEDKKGVPAEWTAFNAKVPEGAKYFAIRCVSSDKFMLFIDDITYTPAKSYTVKGYNVYRDGVKITEKPVEDAKFVDKTVEKGKHTYHVTVVYEHGESKASQPVDLNFTAVDELGAEALSIKAGEGSVVILNADGLEVAVVGLDGKIAFRGQGADRMDIAVPAGIYVVVAGDKKEKVMVK